MKPQILAPLIGLSLLLTGCAAGATDEGATIPQSATPEAPQETESEPRAWNEFFLEPMGEHTPKTVTEENPLSRIQAIYGDTVNWQDKLLISMSEPKIYVPSTEEGIPGTPYVWTDIDVEYLNPALNPEISFYVHAPDGDKYPADAIYLDRAADIEDSQPSSNPSREPIGYDDGVGRYRVALPVHEAYGETGEVFGPTIEMNVIGPGLGGAAYLAVSISEEK